MKSIETAVAEKGMMTLDALAPEALVDPSINDAALKEKKRLKKLKAKAKKAEAKAAGLVDGVATELVTATAELDAEIDAPGVAEVSASVASLSAPVLRSKTSRPFIKRAAKTEGAESFGADRPSFEGGPKPFGKPGSEGGIKPRAEGGFKPRGEGGFKPRGRFGAEPRGEGRPASSYGQPRDGGSFGGARTWSRPKSKGWVGGRAAAEGGADVGLGRAPVDRNEGWSKPKGPWSKTSPRSSFGAGGAGSGAPKRSFGGGKPFGKKKEGGFDKPRWNKDKG
jgi:hypothetical protein